MFIGNHAVLVIQDLFIQVHLLFVWIIKEQLFPGWLVPCRDVSLSEFKELLLLFSSWQSLRIFHVCLSLIPN